MSNKTLQRRYTQSRDQTPSSFVDTSETPLQSESIELPETRMFSDTAETYALGQYPKARRYPLKALLRLAAIVICLCTLGYFGIATLRSPSSRVETLDPRLLSVHCDVPHPGKPLVQYVLMIDAGSTGSRIHVYKFNYCKQSPELEDEVFEQIKPGLSSYDNAEEAARSLDSLMQVGMKHVPKSLRACTPVAVKATAGLRKLGAEKSELILRAIERRLSSNYPFKLIPDSPVQVMDGKDEGIYAWITVNYLLNTLGKEEHQTAATFDLGGGSTQIVFEPQYERWNNRTGLQLAPGEHRYEMSYGGQEYTLYQHSYLGFGLMEARKAFKQKVAQELANNGKFSVEHPCFPPGFREEVSGKSPITIKGSVKQSLDAKGQQDQCYQQVRKLFNKNAPCQVAPCSFDGVYQPELSSAFATNPFYIFSYFYDRTYPLHLRDEFSLRDFKQLTDKVCSFDLDKFSKEEQEEIAGESHYCLDLSFQYALLVDGVGMSPNRTVRSTRKIEGAETGWCLGASLAILDQHNYC
ncbi:Guanosine-diphosphatase [Coemansia sp. RSA 989]|nr:Guanosine-diphosphatase [Coemansia sp. RSA 1086]KAJ1868122.1 Guanosine-diphosphatase [Coemansia sp. RSA 989]KAJ2676360.1 Guanosine-diphosphatase [Coemansia sp. RSA 1085]